MRPRSVIELFAIAATALAIQACSKEPPKPVPSAPAEAAAPTQATAVIPPEEGAVATATASTATATDDAGAKAFKIYCETCHGATGAGDGPASAALNPKPASFATGAFKYDPNGNGTKGDLDDVQAIIRDGAAKYGGSPLMAGWPMLNAEQREAVAKHVKSLGGG